MTIILLEMPAIHIALLAVGVASVLSILGWLFLTQIATNKSFKEALTEFRIAITMLDQQNKTQNLMTGQIREDVRDLADRLNEHIVDTAHPYRKKLHQNNLQS